MAATVEAGQHTIRLGQAAFQFPLCSSACDLGLKIAPYFPDDDIRSAHGFFYSLAILSGTEPFLIGVEKGPRYGDPYLNVLEGKSSHYILSNILNLYEALRSGGLEVQEKVLLKDEEIVDLIEQTGSVIGNRQRLEQMLTIPALEKAIPVREQFSGTAWTVPAYIGQLARALT